MPEVFLCRFLRIKNAQEWMGIADIYDQEVAENALSRDECMQIGSTTYAAAPVWPSVASGRTAGIESAHETDRYEPSEQVLGAARSLPGQGGGFEIDGSFGFCAHCNTTHGLSGKKGEEVAVNGVPVPDLHAMGEAVAEESGEVEGDAEEQAFGARELNQEDQQVVQELKQRDQEVRTHEHAHVAAGGQYVRGGVQYEYQTGPDGKRYAVGGEVSIDTSPVSGDPEATIRKAQTIRRAALAPAQPSAQDRRAAAAASQMEMKARQEMMAEKLEGEGETSAPAEGGLSASEADETLGEERVDAGHGAGALDDHKGIDAKPEGLPKASASDPPLVKLDYGRQMQDKHQIDVYR